MLNYTDAIRAGTTGFFRFDYSSYGPIWMDNVMCAGNESNIEDCTFPGWGLHNCYHWEDATVACDGECQFSGGVYVDMMGRFCTGKKGDGGGTRGQRRREIRGEGRQGKGGRMIGVGGG